MRTLVFYLLILPILFMNNAIATNKILAGPPHYYAILEVGDDSNLDDKKMFHEQNKIFASILGKRGWLAEIMNQPAKKISQNEKKLHCSELNKTRSMYAFTGALQQAKSGDQIFYIFNGHGEKRKDNEKQQSHSIISSEGYDINLDCLQKPIQDAVKRGVKVALTDLSCYSGNLQALAKSTGACLVSSAPKNYVAAWFGVDPNEDFANAFLQSLSSNPMERINLLDYFVKIRGSAQKLFNFPQISSVPYPAASGWDDLFSLTDPYSYDRNDRIKEKKLLSGENYLCNEIMPFKNLKQQLEASIAVIKKQKKSAVNMEKIYRGLQLLLEVYRENFVKINDFETRLITGKILQDGLLHLGNNSLGAANNSSFTTIGTQFTSLNGKTWSDNTIQKLKHKQEDLMREIIKLEQEFYDQFQYQSRVREKQVQIWQGIFESKDPCEFFFL